ncbi:MAG: nuclear transport factor 2 family protein [Pseudomonadota bacterium]
MLAKDFVGQYETALGSQDWAMVDPLIASNAQVIFSNGALHKGKAAIRAAYEKNFAAINSEDYKMTRVDWLLATPHAAAYVFEFRWSGLIRGQAAGGAGRGTTVLALENERWVLMAEHLGPMA